MKTSLIALVLLAGCGGSGEARVEINLRTSPCPSDGECTTHLVGEGLIYTDGDDRASLYAEIFTSSGALALIEIGDRVRYREIIDGRVALSARVQNERVDLANGTFAFEGVDPLAAADAEPARTITDGRILLYDEGAEVPERTPRPRRDDDRDHDTYDPEPDPYDRDTDVDVTIDTSGCDDVDPEPASSGGCDDGCEGDTSSSGGCEGDTGGCEGDVADSGGDCSSCSGDTAFAKRPYLGLLRLSWPIALAGWFNRKRRRTSQRGLVHEALLRAGAFGPRSGHDDHRPGEVVVEGARATIDDEP